MTTTAAPLTSRSAATGHFLPAGTGPSDGAFTLVVTPETAGWGHTSLRVLELAPRQTVEFRTGGDEWILLSLSGACTVVCDSEQLTLKGRAGVFTGVSDQAYLPVDSLVTITSAEGGRFALPGARTGRRLPFRYGPAADVPVELRGSGTCSRQVNNFGTPGAFETDQLIACEVLTPGGNWSSYPPHKHDEQSENETALEEIYYYEIAPGGSPGRAGLGYQRVYGTRERPIEVLEEVRSGDVVLVPHGWHGPSMAAPGYDMYYLNAMAGPGVERAWRICDDPAHGWVRGTWTEQDVDRRLPLYRN